MTDTKIKINDIIYEILNEMGLSVSNENYIIFQSGEPIKFKGKDIRFSYENRFIIDGSKEIWFDPINNSEIIKFFYNYYTVEHYKNERIKIISTQEMQDKKSFTYKLYVKLIDRDGEKADMNTIFYSNINLAYIQIMLRNVMDISQLDIKD